MRTKPNTSSATDIAAVLTCLLIAFAGINEFRNALQTNILSIGRVPEQTVQVKNTQEPQSIEIQIQNNTGDTWGTSGETQAYLVPTRPYPRTSALYDSATWLDVQRIPLTGESVSPGSTASFVFQIRVPLQETYREYFAVSSNGGAVYPDTESAITVITKGTRPPDIFSGVTWSTTHAMLTQQFGDSSRKLQSTSQAPYYYDIVSLPSPVRLAMGESKYVQIQLRNTGTAIWYRDARIGDHPVRLGTARTYDRRSRFYDSATWFSAGRIALREPFVIPGDTGTFAFELRAPAIEDAYREYFGLVVEGSGWAEAAPLIALDIAVGNTDLAILQNIERSQRSNPDKKIKVDLTTQTLQTSEDGAVLGQYPVSTGIWYLPTPTGTFKIQNHSRTAYSRRYNLYMDYWQAFTPDGGYGIHSLPYWKLRGGGILYEGLNHLGKPVSHGCIRLSPENAAIVYAWTEDKKTEVEIVGTTPRP